MSAPSAAASNQIRSRTDPSNRRAREEARSAGNRRSNGYARSAPWPGGRRQFAARSGEVGRTSRDCCTACRESASGRRDRNPRTGERRFPQTFPRNLRRNAEKFEETVVRPFVDSYLAGLTPIPCTLCNNHVKFDQLLLTARQIGADRLATGHYARIRWNADSQRYELLRARDDSKDQSYFLFGLTQQQMARTSFPLGELTKAEVREIARAAALPVAEKPESQEIGFRPSDNY